MLFQFSYNGRWIWFSNKPCDRYYSNRKSLCFSAYSLEQENFLNQQTFSEKNDKIEKWKKRTRCIDRWKKSEEEIENEVIKKQCRNKNSEKRKESWEKTISYKLFVFLFSCIKSFFHVWNLSWFLSIFFNTNGRCYMIADECIQSTPCPTWTRLMCCNFFISYCNGEKKIINIGQCHAQIHRQFSFFTY